MEIMDALLFYAVFLMYIGPFHLVTWTIRFLRRKGKPKSYQDSLITYIKYVGIYILGYALLAVLVNTSKVDLENAAGLYVALAGLFPLYYWKNIFWPTFKKRIKL